MVMELQKASFWKRISSYLFDVILVIVLTVGFAVGLSSALNYDSYTKQLSTYSQQYAQEYGIQMDITEEEYNALSQEEKTKYESANEAFSKDPNVIQLNQTIVKLTLIIIGVGLLLAHLIWYFGIPLLFKNGQTLGKKIFGIAVIRTNGVKASNPVLFIRAIIGQYAIETMFPIFLLTIGVVGVVVIVMLLILQIAMIAVTQTRSAIHDLLTDTVVVDFSSQLIFETEEELVRFKEEEHLKKVAASEDIQSGKTI